MCFLCILFCVSSSTRTPQKDAAENVVLSVLIVFAAHSLRPPKARAKLNCDLSSPLPYFPRVFIHFSFLTCLKHPSMYFVSVYLASTLIYTPAACRGLGGREWKAESRTRSRIRKDNDSRNGGDGA